MKSILDTFERDKRYERGKKSMVVKCGECRDQYDVDETMAESYRRALKKMWDLGRMMHMDLHLGNIYYHDQKIYFIDYGLVLARASIENASESAPYVWKPRQLDEEVVITSVASAYEYSAYDVISYMQDVLSQYVDESLINLFTQWPNDLVK